MRFFLVQPFNLVNHTHRGLLPPYSFQTAAWGLLYPTRVSSGITAEESLKLFHPYTWQNSLSESKSIKLLSFKFQDQIYFLYNWWHKKSKYIHLIYCCKNKLHMSTRMLLIRTCYIYIMANLHLTSDLVQDIEVERALKYLN